MSADIRKFLTGVDELENIKDRAKEMYRFAEIHHGGWDEKLLHEYSRFDNADASGSYRRS